jgi:hypothetical protein
VSGLLGSLVSSVGVAGICVFAAAPSNSCASQPTDTGDAGSAAPDATTPVGQDSGTGAMDPAPSPGDASTDSAPSANADAAASANPDAGASMQGDAGPAMAGANELCRSEWPQSGGLLVPNMYAATDAAGNSYVAVNFVDNRPLSDDAGPPPQLNFGAPPSQVLDGFAIAKFDDACNMVWVREFGPASAPYSYGAQTVRIATDAASNVTILGDFFGSVDFGKGMLTAGSEIDNGFLLRLDSTGKTVFSTQFVNTRSGTSIMESDLAVTQAGVSTIAVYADSDTDFGNGQDSVSLLLGVKSSNDLVQFDTSGKVLFRKTVPSIDSSLSAIYGLATNASGFLWGAAVGTSLSSPSVMNYPKLTVGITASGASAWQQTVTEDPLIAAGPSGAVTFSSPGSSSTETLQGLASDGSTQWTVSTTIPSGTPQRGLLVVDSSGNPLILDLFRGTIAFGSAPALTSAGGNDLVYQTFDATGHLRSTGAWGGPEDDDYGGIGVDPAGNLLVAGNTTPLTGATTSRVFFVKLAP